MRRRDLLRASLSIPLLAATPRAEAAPAPAATPFDSGTVRTLARQLAQKPYQAPDTKLPDALAKLDANPERLLQ